MNTYLKLKFKTSKGKFAYMRISNPKKGLTKELVQEAMVNIAGTRAFRKDDQILYLTPLAAKYVTTTEEAIVVEEKVN